MFKDVHEKLRQKWRGYAHFTLVYDFGKLIKKALLEYLTARPSVYIDEQIYFLWDEFDVHVTEKSVQRMLKRVKWTKKQVQNPLF